MQYRKEEGGALTEIQPLKLIATQKQWSKRYKLKKSESEEKEYSITSPVKYKFLDGQHSLHKVFYLL